MRRVATNPLTPSPEQQLLSSQPSAEEYVHDWLARQDDGVTTPARSIRSSPANDDDGITSISQRNDDDPPFMDIEHLAKVMKRYGWGFRFVSPNDMDVEMRRAVAEV